MAEDCYAMVRGSGIRLTHLDSRGALDETEIRTASSKSVIKVTINEVTESGGNELLRTDDDEPRIHFITNDVTVRYDVDIDFLRCDPSILNLMTSVPLALNAQGDIVGFDQTTRLKAKSFALEVWSKILGFTCAEDARLAGFGEMNFGEESFGDDGKTMLRFGKPYGYTVFPWLKGGTISGFAFTNGLVSFNVKGARTQRGPKWGVGPYDLEGPHMRLLQPVSRNTAWRTFISTGPPPEGDASVSTFEDIIYGGDVNGSTPDIFDANTGPWTLGKN